MSKDVLPEKYFDIAFMRDGTFYMHYSENFSADDIYMTLSFFASVAPDAFAEACERRDGESTAEWTERLAAGSRPAEPCDGSEL